MRLSITRSALVVAASVLYSSTPIAAQTYTTCNPLKSGGCPPDPALGKSVKIDFTQGASDSFTPSGNPTYDSNGASFTVAKSGDSSQLASKWYIMFGHVEFVIKAAPGVGIVSSAVLQSDDLDEIDWEWLGGDDTQVQSNYFGKGQTTTYNRGAFHPAPGNHDGFHTYTIDWTSDQIVWQIDGTTVRALTAANAEANQYPQTPLMIKVGCWSGGDPSNPRGTIQWAGGPTNYGAGPFTMQVKSIAVTDYSTGSQYTYSGTSGSWNSIQAVGGKVNPNGGSGDTTAANLAAPVVIATSNSAPMPFEGTLGKDPTSTFVTPSVYPWVPDATAATTLQSVAASVTSYPGLPSGWTVTNSGKVLPPSAAPSTSPATSSPSPLSPASPAAGGLEVVTSYNQQGFPTLVTVDPAAASSSKQYDGHGFVITSPTATPTSNIAADVGPSSTSPLVYAVKVSGAAKPLQVAKALGAACGFLGGALVL